MGQVLHGSATTTEAIRRAIPNRKESLGALSRRRGINKRMNRTITDATVKRYDDHDRLRRHMADFIDANNFGRRLKTLRGLTPYEFICKIWTTEPKRFTIDPVHPMPGLNIWSPHRREALQRLTTSRHSL